MDIVRHRPQGELPDGLPLIEDRQAGNIVIVRRGQHVEGNPDGCGCDRSAGRKRIQAFGLLYGVHGHGDLSRIRRLANLGGNTAVDRGQLRPCTIHPHGIERPGGQAVKRHGNHLARSHGNVGRGNRIPRSGEKHAACALGRQRTYRAQEREENRSFSGHGLLLVLTGLPPEACLRTRTQRRPASSRPPSAAR